jgi:DNA-binding Lrp family transcriptional regulator
VRSPLRSRISARIWEIVDGLLSHDVQIRIIAKVTGISSSWIYERKRKLRDG